MSSGSAFSTEDLKAFELECENAGRAVRQAGSMRDAIHSAQVSEPHALRGIGRTLPGHRRLMKALYNRLEELLATQLEVASRMQETYNLDRELDHLKVHEWYLLRTDYPELYAKGMSAAILLRQRMEQRRRRK